MNDRVIHLDQHARQLGYATSAMTACGTWVAPERVTDDIERVTCPACIAEIARRAQCEDTNETGNQS